MFFTETRFKKGKKLFNNRDFRPVERQARYVDYFATWEEVFACHAGEEWVFDCESYVNYFLFMAKHTKTGKYVAFEDFEGHWFDRTLLNRFLWKYLLVGFNSESYDLLVAFLAANGYGPLQLKEVTRDLIEFGKTPREVMKEHKFFIPTINHIDLIEVAPLSASLKIYAGRLHCKRMQDLPYPPEKTLTAGEAAFVKEYCANDLDNTELLLNGLREDLALREGMSKEYDIDLRSKSDAQIAQAVIVEEIKKKTGKYPPKSRDLVGTSFRYEAPHYIRYHSPQLQQMLSDMLVADIYVGDSGHVICPPAIEGKTVTIGGNVYKIGVGGLHSQEKSVCYIATEEQWIVDDDVASYYPNLMLTLNSYPEGCGPVFLEVFKMLVERRLAAKKAKRTIEAGGLKIVTNGTFGKLSDPYSPFYDPNKMVKTTISGQLALLMLVERMEMAGIKVISANTDGIVKLVRPDQYEAHQAIMRQWEQDTSLETEQTKYKGLFQANVNNYIAIKEDGKCKTKGWYSERGSARDSVLSKNPETLILSDAVQAFLSKGTPVEETIYNCKDIRRFLSVRQVKGGAHKDGVFLGKAIRWYYTEGERGCILTVGADGKVPKSDGAKPIMDLPDHFPNDISYDWYVNEANEMLFDLGYYRREKQVDFAFMDEV